MDFLNECLSFSRFHTFLSVLLGPTPDQIFCHWLWFLKVSDPSPQAWPALPEIWPHFGFLCLIFYTLMQSEVARLSSPSLQPLPHQPAHLSPPLYQVSLVTSFTFQVTQLGLIFSVDNVNNTVILRGIKQADVIFIALMKPNAWRGGGKLLLQIMALVTFNNCSRQVWNAIPNVFKSCNLSRCDDFNLHLLSSLLNIYIRLQFGLLSEPLLLPSGNATEDVWKQCVYCCLIGRRSCSSWA